MQEYIDNSAAMQQLDISTRLAALNRWQEEQKRLLDERQNAQRQMLGMEQRNMYQMLGLLHKENQVNDTDDESILELSGEKQNIDASYMKQQPSIETMRCAYNQTEKNQEYTQADGAVKPKRPYLRRGQGLKQRFKIDPDDLRLDKLPRYKFANAHPQYRVRALVKQKKNIPQARKELSADKRYTRPPAAPPAPGLDLNEQRFQQLLIGSKNTCNSTPDLKSSSASTNSSVSPKVRFVELNTVAQSKGQSADDENSTEAGSMTGMCWAKVLDSQQIKPMPMLQRRTAQIRVEGEENVSIFEMLEQKAREGNIDMNSSCIRAFMSRKEQRREPADDSDVILTQQMKGKRLQPEVCEVIDDADDDEDENLDSAIDDTGSRTLTLTPMRVGKTQVRVRFSDSNDTHEYSNETLTDVSTMHGTSNGGNVELFEQFKSALFQALDNRKSPADEQLTQELQVKADLVRQRLEELEVEISTFKEQNLQLMRLKQQHELEKAKCAQEHREAMEHVHDEKIQAEIYLHDERMKIEEERRKFEQQMRLQKSNMNTKEKKEIAALKQEVESLQLQLKQREQAHVAAQARLRAQLRATEKEQRSFRDEIELLNKENKRLEQELIKIGRENNHKMLQEINRNIARLAPKVTLPSESGVDENTRRTKSVDGVSAIKPTKRRETNRRQSMSILRSSMGRLKSASPPLQDSDAADSSSDSDTDPPIEPETQPLRALATSTAPAPAEPAVNKSSEFKREIVNDDGSKDIWYPNGNLKKISADGMTVRMLYFNKDIKETDIRAGTVKYYYAETNTWHTTYLDGLEILEFPNGQTEHRHKDGIIEIHFPNNIIKIVDPNDPEKLEEWRYADGSHLVQLRNGDKILSLANGQKEIHTKLNKRREYPDGTVKLVYPDGSQETRYSNGRVRLKDKDGKLVMDTDYAKY